MYLMDYEVPSNHCFGDFINEELTDTVVAIFRAVMKHMDCFIPLMEKFKELYGFYPKFPVADAGYGSYNNYLFCQQHGMEKYMKFPMFEKETKDERYHNDPFRAVNFKTDPDGNLCCPNNKKFHFAYRKAVKGNLYGRQNEIYMRRLYRLPLCRAMQKDRKEPNHLLKPGTHCYTRGSFKQPRKYSWRVAADEPFDPGRRHLRHPKV